MATTVDRRLPTCEPHRPAGLTHELSGIIWLMDLKLTTKAEEALSAAVRDAAAAGHPHVEPAHILLALTRQTETTTGPVLEATGSSSAAAAQSATAILAHTPQVAGSSVTAPGLSRASLAVLEQAHKVMESMGDAFVSTDHLLL